MILLFMVLINYDDDDEARWQCLILVDCDGKIVVKSMIMVLLSCLQSVLMWSNVILKWNPSNQPLIVMMITMMMFCKNHHHHHDG